MTQDLALSERQAEQRLLEALRGRQGRLTLADAAVLSGLPVEVAGQTLQTLLGTYRSHLAVTDQGELLYSFDPSLRRRDAEPLRVKLERLAARLWQLFVLAFKIAIVAVLVIYFLIFVALILGVLFARLSGRSDDRRGGGLGGSPHGSSLWLLWWFLPWDVGPRQGRRRTPAGWSAPGRQRPRRKAYELVFRFVFGPGQSQQPAGAADREVLAYLRAHQGRLTASDLVGLRGLSLAQAEEEATRLMCDYDGEPEVVDPGVVVYVFRRLRLSAGQTSGSWRYWWQQQEQRPPLTGNSAGANLVIALLNGFNLLAPLWAVPQAVVHLGLDPGLSSLWLGTVPLVFSGTFFAVPASRALLRAWRERGRLRRHHRRLLLAHIFAADSGRSALAAERLGALELEQLTRQLADSPAEQAALRHEADALVLALDGDILLERGPSWVHFPRLAEELAAVEQARALAPAEETQLGEVVFDSAKGLEENPEMRRKSQRRRLLPDEG